jgi:hypothetical protein
MSRPTTFAHKRRKSSNHKNDIPDFLENSPFFIQLPSSSEEPPKPYQRPSLKQIILSSQFRKSIYAGLAVLLFWYLIPRKGDYSHRLLGQHGLLRGGGAQCLYDPKAVAIIPDEKEAKIRLSTLDWEKHAYVTYVTHHEVLCNAVMMFESLKRLGSKAKMVMLIPDTEEFALEGYGSRSATADATVKRLLRGTVEEGVELVRVRVLRREMSYRRFYLLSFYLYREWSERGRAVANEK